ncbi:MAG: hypothetical protein OHK0036_09340 [Bacteroidia bacterium]
MKQKITILFFVITGYFHFCLSQQNVLQINTPQSGNVVNAACKEVKLKPGYHYLSTPGNAMHTYIDPNAMCAVNYIASYNNNNIPPINTNNEVGSVPGNFAVTETGAATYQVPIELPPGTAGVMPNLSVVYNSQGGDGLLGWGWQLSGLSAITRVNKTIYHDGEVAGVTLTNNDAFALDGMRLFPLSGNNGGNGTLYGTEVENFTLINSYGQQGNGPQYFIVTGKDGTIMEYGNTSDSRILAGSNNAALMWLINKIQDANGNYYVVHYNQLNNNNTIEYRPDYIEYTGNTANGLTPYNKVKFIYNTRNDINSFYIAGMKIINSALLSEIQVYSDNKIIRRYEFSYSLSPLGNSRLVEIKMQGSDGRYVNSTKFVWDNMSIISSWNDITNYQNLPSTTPIPIDFIQVTGGSNYVSNYYSSYNSLTIKATEYLPAGQSYTYYDDKQLFLSIDFNGDGKDDIVKLKIYNYPNLVNIGISSYTEMINASGVGFTYMGGNNLSFSIGSANSNIRMFGIENHTHLKNNSTQVDLDNDGLEDILISFDLDSPLFNTYIQPTFLCLFSNGNGTFSSNVFSLSNELVSYMGYNTTLGDYDGDGYMDMFIFIPQNSNAYLYSFKNKNITQLYAFNLPISFTNSQSHLTSVDMNGDNKNEILLTSTKTVNSNYLIEINKVNNNYSFNISNPLGYPTGWHRIYPGNFNSDGKTDLLTWSSSAGWEIALSKDNNSFEIVPFNTLSTISNALVDNGDPMQQNNGNYHIYYPIDVNGDGLSDVIDLGFNPTGAWNNTTIVTLINNGVKFIPEWKNSNNLTLIPLMGNVFGDFDGDGNKETFLIFLSPHNAQFTYLVSFNPNSNHNKITDIVDGFNNSVSIEYASLPQLKDINQYQYTMWSFPLVNSKTFITNLLTCVKSNTNNASTSQSTINKYTYFNAIYNTDGKGFLGFLGFQEENLSNNFKTLKMFDINPPYISGNFVPILQKKLYRINSYQNGNLIHKQDINYNFLIANQLPFLSSFSFPRCFFYPSYIEDIDILTGNKVKKSVQMDNFGNVVNQTIQYFDGNNTLIETQQTTHTYGAFCFPYNNKLINSTSIITRTGEQPYTRFQNYSYYPSSQYCRLKSINDDKGVATEYEYDNFGNVKKTKISGPTIGTDYIVNQAIYDSKGRFPIQSINTLGHIIEKTYDDFGNVLSEKDPNGLVTTYQYDGFNRVIKTIEPTGNVVNTNIQWSLNMPINGIVYCVHMQSSNQGYTKKYYNQIQQLIRTEVPALNSPYPIITQNEYDINGLLIKKSLPSFNYNFNFNTALSITYQYDNLLRLINTTYPNGNQINISYVGNTTNTQVQQNSVIKNFSKTLDPTGKVISVSDDAGTVTYEYFSNGHPKKITAPDNHIVTMQYDNFGRQTQLNDPNAGITTYNYDELDRLISQTDAQNHTYTMMYDPLGRLLSKTGPEGTTTYQYDTKPYGIGQLASITGFNNINADFSYDNIGRLQSKTELINNNTYTYQYQYDAQGRVNQMIFPSGWGLKYQYNSDGYLEYIRQASDNEILWKCMQKNQYSQTTYEAILPNIINASINNNFDNLGILQSQVFMEFPAYSIASIHYNFNSNTHNLQQKIENSSFPHYSFYSTYSFDIMDRLISTTSFTNPSNNLLQQINLSYSSSGNIISKSDAGDFVYDPVKTHAVKRIDNPTSDLLNKPTQNITYTPFLQPDKITEANYELQYTYAYDHQRRISELKQNGTTIKKIIYQDDYEEITIGSTTYSVHYVYSPDKLFTIMVRYPQVLGGKDSLYEVITDYQGNILGLINEQGRRIAYQSFDAWGREIDVHTGSYNITTNVRPAWLIRGYTGHEHLPEFGLINMNGRLYDPQLARMLSPDNFVQDATSTQGFNRYSYVLNNPLKYKDPSGEVYLLDDLIVGAAGFVIGYVSYGIMHDNWGWKAVGAGGIGAGIALLSYYTAGGFALAAGGTASGGATFAGNYAISSAVNIFMPSVTVPITDNFSISMSIGLGVSSSGLGGGFNVSGNYSKGDFGVSFGYGAGEGGTGSYSGYGGSIRIGDFGAGYNRTSYSGENSQVVGGVSLSYKNVSFRLENDFFGDKHDRWRSNAFELTIGDFVLGSNLYNNDVGPNAEFDDEGRNLLGKCNRPKRDGTVLGAWKEGQTYSSPLWVGFKSNGQVYRFGYSHPLVQDRTQNVIHKWFGPGKTHFFNRYDNFQRGGYNYFGYNNPYSLW